MSINLTVPATPTPFNLKRDVSLLPALGRHAVDCFDEWEIPLPDQARQALLSTDKHMVLRALQDANKVVLRHKPPKGLPGVLRGKARPNWADNPFHPMRAPKLVTN